MLGKVHTSAEVVITPYVHEHVDGLSCPVAPRYIFLVPASRGPATCGEGLVRTVFTVLCLFSSILRFPFKY